MAGPGGEDSSVLALGGGPSMLSLSEERSENGMTLAAAAACVRAHAQQRHCDDEQRVRSYLSFRLQQSQSLDPQVCVNHRRPD